MGVGFEDLKREVDPPSRGSVVVGGEMVITLDGEASVERLEAVWVFGLTL